MTRDDLIGYIAMLPLAWIVVGAIWSWISWRCGRCKKRFIPFSLSDKYIGRFYFGAICGQCIDKCFDREKQRLEERRKKAESK